MAADNEAPGTPPAPNFFGPILAAFNRGLDAGAKQVEGQVAKLRAALAEEKKAREAAEAALVQERAARAHERAEASLEAIAFTSEAALREEVELLRELERVAREFHGDADDMGCGICIAIVCLDALRAKEKP